MVEIGGCYFLTCPKSLSGLVSGTMLTSWGWICAGVQPPQDPGKPEGETASAIAIDLEREIDKNVVDKKIEERKRLIFLGLQ